MSEFPAEVDVAIVGAGPAGLAMTFDLFALGIRTLTLDAGGGGGRPQDLGLLQARISDPDRHALLHMAISPGVGGTSQLWGGRAMALDPADFDAGAGRANWPITYEDLVPWWRKAADFLGTDAILESPAPGGFADLTRHVATRSESWAPELDMARRWRRRLKEASGPPILPGARLIGFLFEGRRIVGLRFLAGGETRTLRARRVALATGGLGALRLLLNLNMERPGLVLGSARLGRGYMGHLTGAIADFIPRDVDNIAAFGCLPRTNGGATRRRIQPTAMSLLEEERLNIAFWLDNPPIGDHAHGSAAASAKYLIVRQALLGRRLMREGWRVAALRGETEAIGPHLKNIALAPHLALIGLASAVVSRLADRYRRPVRLLSAGDGGWRLHYHAEQGENPVNRVTLSDYLDADGLRQPQIFYGVAQSDVRSVVRGHIALDADLKAAQVGRLRWLHAQNDLEDAVLAAARDGYHQLGGAAMAHTPAHGVTDVHGQVFGVEGLYISSSALFPRGGQANPTLTIVALAHRLANHLGRDRSDGS